MSKEVEIPCGEYRGYEITVTPSMTLGAGLWGNEYGCGWEWKARCEEPWWHYLDGERCGRSRGLAIRAAKKAIREHLSKTRFLEQTS